jgi:hypothetical protein
LLVPVTTATLPASRRSMASISFRSHDEVAPPEVKAEPP